MKAASFSASSMVTALYREARMPPTDLEQQTQPWRPRKSGEDIPVSKPLPTVHKVQAWTSTTQEKKLHFKRHLFQHNPTFTNYPARVATLSPVLNSLPVNHPPQGAWSFWAMKETPCTVKVIHHAHTGFPQTSHIFRVIINIIWTSEMGFTLTFPYMHTLDSDHTHTIHLW